MESDGETQKHVSNSYQVWDIMLDIEGDSAAATAEKSRFLFWYVYFRLVGGERLVGGVGWGKCQKGRFLTGG